MPTWRLTGAVTTLVVIVLTLGAGLGSAAARGLAAGTPFSQAPTAVDLANAGCCGPSPPPREGLPGVDTRPGVGPPVSASPDPTVLSTLVLANNSIVPSNFLPTNPKGEAPSAVAYDPAKGELFVTNANRSLVDVVSDVSNRVVHTISEPYDPYALAYDPNKGEIFSANFASNNVSVINDTSNAVVAAISVGTKPYSIAYDSVKHEIFVSNYGSNNVSVIDDSTNKVVANIGVGTTPNGIAFDSAKKEMFVVNHAGYPSSTVSVISDSSNSVVATVSVGADPVGDAYDPHLGEIFVTNGPGMPSDNVSVINDKTNAVVATITVGDTPLAAVYDAASQEMLISNNCGVYGPPPSPCLGSVSVVSAAANSVVSTLSTGSGPWGLAYDSASGLTYVCNVAQGTLSILTTGPVNPQSVQTYPTASAVDGVAANKTMALLPVEFPNDTSELVLFDGATNVSRVIQAEVPGGQNDSLVGLTSAAGEFFLEWQNLSSGNVFWQKVSLAGKISYPSIPLNKGLVWSILDGNATSLFASVGRILVEINATTLKIAANFTKDVPKNLTFDSALPVGSRLYLAGSWSVSGHGPSAYFGYLNLTTGKLHTISPVVKTHPSGLVGTDTSIATMGADVYVGGALTLATSSTAFHSVGGYFERYNVTTSTLVNLSSLLPVENWGVFAIAPWGTTIGLSLSDESLNATIPVLSFPGGIYSLAVSQNRLVNESSDFPLGFTCFVLGETSVSDGWYYSGGYNQPGGNLLTGVAQVVAVKP